MKCPNHPTIELEVILGHVAPCPFCKEKENPTKSNEPVQTQDFVNRDFVEKQKENK